MLFGRYGDATIGRLQFKQGDSAIFQELCSNRSTYEIGKLGGAHRQVLLDLNDAKLLAFAFCLNRQYKMDATPVEADVYLIGLDLTDARHRCSKMVLQRIAGQAGKHIDKPVISQTRQKGLLIVQGILADDTGGGIQDFRLDE